MLSPDFIQQLAKMRRERTAKTEFHSWAEGSPLVHTGGGAWKTGAYTGTQPQVIVYDSTTGKAYPNPQTAVSAGVTTFSYNIPSGMTVDWSWWKQFNQPLPAEAPPYEITVADQTFGFDTGEEGAGEPAAATPPTVIPPANEPPPPGPEPGSEPPPPPDYFQGISAGRLAEAKRYASAGMFGRAKQQVELGGGTWVKDGDLSKQFRSQVKAADPRSDYGGSFNWNKADPSGGKTTKAGMETALTKIGSDMKMGEAKAAIIAAGGKWSDRMHVRLLAEKKRREEQA